MIGEEGRTPPLTTGRLAIAVADGASLNRHVQPSHAQRSSIVLALDGRTDDGATLPGVGTMAGFERWGADAPAHFRGAFALAWWDETAERLLLACDPLGLRSLYYARCDDRIAFATSLRALLALPDIPRTLDDAYLAAFLTDVFPEPGATFYAAIRRVPAACTVAFDPRGASTTREYWRPDWGRRIRLPRDEDYVDEARRLLDQAVRRQLPKSGPVICHLSGGLDSGAVTATAARLTAPAMVHALTLAPPTGVARPDHPHLITDEREPAASVAALYPNIAWECLSSPDLHPVDENPLRLFLPMGMPCRNAMNIGWFAQSYDRARALGTQVLLCGTFGNMTLTWDGLPGLAAMARCGDWLRLWREVRALARAQGTSPLAVLRSRVLRPLLPPRWQAWLDDVRGRQPKTERYSPIHPDFARMTDIRARSIAMGHYYPGDTDTMRRRWLTRVQTLPGVRSGLMEAFGIELRDPTADLDLLEFCFAVPDEQYCRDGVTRWLARRVLADRLPPLVVNETRRGFQCPEFLHRMTLQRDAIVEGVAALERSPLASRALDVARMKKLAENWPTTVADAPFAEYGAILDRGLHAGRFLRWVEGSNQ